MACLGVCNLLLLPMSGGRQPNQSDWGSMMKDAAKSLQVVDEDDSIEVVVLPPRQPVPSQSQIHRQYQKQDIMSAFTRKKHRKEGEVINLQGGAVSTLAPSTNPIPNKIAVPIVGFSREREKRKAQVINVEVARNPTIQLYRQRMFRKEERPIKASGSAEAEEVKEIIQQSRAPRPLIQARLVPSQSDINIVRPGVPVRDSKREIERQIREVDRMNEPVWSLQREERRAINREKYPNSYTHSYGEVREDKYGFSGMRRKEFSGMGSSDKNHKQFLERREVQLQEKREQKRREKEEEDRKRKQDEERRKLQDHEEILSYFSSMNPVKKVKLGTEVVQLEAYPEGEAVQQLGQAGQQVANTEEVMVAEGGEEAVQGVGECANRGVRRQQRLGLRDVQNYQKLAPEFVKALLRHRYGKEKKLETRKIPEVFDGHVGYKQAFHQLILNECVADVRKRMENVERSAPEPMRVIVTGTKMDGEGLVVIELQEKVREEKIKAKVEKNRVQDKGKGKVKGEEGKDKGEGAFQLRNLSLSRYRLGLLCSSREYHSDYYGVSSRERGQFGVLVMLVTPQTKEELRNPVRALGAFSESNFNMALLRRGGQLCFFDLEKVSTSVREYLAVTNIECSQLAASIRNPELVKGEEGMFVEGGREMLADILDVLRQVFNQTQWSSIREMALRKSGFVLLQGPPGTGKTSTLIGLLSAQYECLRKCGDERKILICAPSNAAVDLIVRRIRTDGLLTGEGKIFHPRVLRTGIVETTDPLVREVSLDEQCERRLRESQEEEQQRSAMSTAEIKENIIRLQAEMRREGIRADSAMLKAKEEEIRDLERRLYEFKTEKWFNRKRAYSAFEEQFLSEAQIVVTTLASSGSDKVDRLRGEIGCLIVDEAAQATEPNLLIALQTNVQKVILIGDPYQLPATCVSQDANLSLFNRSLLERFLDAGVRPYFLNIQYRMAPAIREFPSSRFYQGRLVDAPQLQQREMPAFLERFAGRNVAFVDVGFGREERKGESYCNRGEAQVVSRLVQCLITPELSLGVITPYQAQRAEVKRACMRALRRNEDEKKMLEESVLIDTVDSFQGQERQVILVSAVRANSAGSVGFLRDERRTNVTLTRAKSLLVVVGHGDTLGSNQVWSGFLDWCEQRGSYYQVGGREQIDDTVELLLDCRNPHPVRRRRHLRMSSDVRKIHREECGERKNEWEEDGEAEKEQGLIYQGESEERRDFGRKQERERPKYRGEVKAEVQKRQQVNKFALSQKDSKQILEQKKKQEQKALQFEQAQERMRIFEEQNKQRLRSDDCYKDLVKRK